MYKSILITTFNRPIELKASLDALKSCVNYSEFNLVVVYHEENEKNIEILSELDGENNFFIPVNGKEKSPIENMNFNRILGMNYCINELNSEFVIALEDDIVLGYDALFFCDILINRYCNDSEFRAVNLGSREPLTKFNKFEYGLFRYGLFGQASAMTAKVWKQILSLGLLSKIDSEGLDGIIEAYMKSGFVVMPYASRYIDIGWKNGTHAPRNENDTYYNQLKKSFCGVGSFSLESYRLSRHQYNWRRDCQVFRKGLIFNLHHKLKSWLFDC